MNISSCMAIGSLVLTSTALLATPITERVSVSSLDEQANAYSGNPSISADGRYVAFYSDASNLVPGDTNGFMDVFVRDLVAGTTERVSVSTSGAEGNDFTLQPDMGSNQISADGRYVVFSSYATNLVPNPPSPSAGVYLRDRTLGTTELISNAPGYGPISGWDPAISRDGRYIVYTSSRNPDGTPAGYGIIVRYDRSTGNLVAASVPAFGSDLDGGVNNPSISDDGRFVMFFSDATNLVPDGTSLWRQHAYVRDLITGTTILASSDAAGMEGNDYTRGLGEISGNGMYAALSSVATNLVVNDINGYEDIFIKHLPSGKITRITAGGTGIELNGPSIFPKFSPDGRYVSFNSEATNIVPGDTNNRSDVFVFDYGSDVWSSFSIQRVSVTTAGGEQNGNSNFWHYGAMSWQADFIAFGSSADNLVPADTNQTDDIFVRGPLN